MSEDMRSRISFILKMEGEWKEIKSLRWDKALRVLRERERESVKIEQLERLYSSIYIEGIEEYNIYTLSDLNDEGFS